MTMIALAYLQATRNFDPGLLYVGAFLFDIGFISMLTSAVSC